MKYYLENVQDLFYCISQNVLPAIIFRNFMIIEPSMNGYFVNILHVEGTMNSKMVDNKQIWTEAVCVLGVCSSQSTIE